jgi:carbon storage regulator
MLVLSRRVGDQVVIPELGVTLTVVSVDRHRVRLGITAPAETAVHREEVWQRARQPQGGSAPPP